MCAEAEGKAGPDEHACRNEDTHRPEPVGVDARPDPGIVSQLLLQAQIGPLAGAPRLGAAFRQPPLIDDQRMGVMKGDGRALTVPGMSTGGIERLTVPLGQPGSLQLAADASGHALKGHGLGRFQKAGGEMLARGVGLGEVFDSLISHISYLLSAQDSRGEESPSGKLPALQNTFIDYALLSKEAK